MLIVVNSDLIPRSLSAAVMQAVNHYRNDRTFGSKIIAQAAYQIIATAALVETVAATAITVLSTLSLPFTKNYFNVSVEWLKSSSFAVVWSVFNFIINPFCYRVAEYESTAKIIASLWKFILFPSRS